MADHNDVLGGINKHVSLQEKLVETHRTLCEVFPFIVRIAIALYDPKTGMLKTYLHSSGDDNPLSNYQALLDDAPSLKSILDKGLPRVINNLLTFETADNEHTARIGRQGYAASYTLPMFDNGVFFGFIFFNSNRKDVFTETVLNQLDIYAHMISLLVLNELMTIRTLSAAVKTTGSIAHVRDPETGSHLDRMSRYSRLIAQELSDKYQLNDTYIEHVFMFAPLHDIGKIGIPDNILLKPDSLDDEERRVMKTHAHIGRMIIDQLLDNFGFHNMEYMHVLRNIAEFHHEAVNGKGYPSGIKGDAIPLEARIVAVADVFDALTSVRPYKDAWDNDAAIYMLQKLAGETLDQDCVNALISNIDKIEEIQHCFRENSIG